MYMYAACPVAPLVYSLYADHASVLSYQSFYHYYGGWTTSVACSHEPLIACWELHSHGRAATLAQSTHGGEGGFHASPCLGGQTAYSHPLLSPGVAEIIHRVYHYTDDLLHRWLATTGSHSSGWERHLTVATSGVGLPPPVCMGPIPLKPPRPALWPSGYEACSTDSGWALTLQACSGQHQPICSQPSFRASSLTA